MVMPRNCDHERSTGLRNGKPYLYCKPCHNARVAERQERIRAEVRKKMTEYLDEHPCVDCGYDRHPALQFDHLDPSEKTLGIAVMLSRAYKWESVLQEIAKCEVRCTNCHTLRTAEQYGWWNKVPTT